MKQLLKTHKKTIAVACTAILLCSVMATGCVPRQPLPDEPVPPGRIHDAGVFGDNITVHDSAGGEVVINTGSAETGVEPAPLKTVSNPETIWNDDTNAGNHTPVEKAQMRNGSIGILTIPKLRLSVNVYQSPDNMEAMLKGVAHFPSTSAWDSNVGLSAHNVNFDGSDGHFKYLYTLEKGDNVAYKTALGERLYTVESVTVIAASDWTPLYYTDDNRLTMITCITGQGSKRLCVTAIQKATI